MRTIFVLLLMLKGIINEEMQMLPSDDELEEVPIDENSDTITLTPGKGGKIPLSKLAGGKKIKIAPPGREKGMPEPMEPPPPRRPDPIAAFSDKPNLKVDLTKEDKDEECDKLDKIVDKIIVELKTRTIRKVFNVGFLNEFDRYMKQKKKFGILEPRGRKKTICAVLKFRTMQDIADFFKDTVEEACYLFGRGVRILSDGGGSVGFREYYDLGVYISEFMNKTGFPKFPLKSETELSISRYFQTMKDEFDDKVANLATPLLPFSRADSEQLGAWLRRTENMNQYVRKVELGTSLPLKEHTSSMKDWLKMLQVNYPVFQYAASAVEMLENAGIVDIDMAICGPLPDDEQSEYDDYDDEEEEEEEDDDDDV